MARGTGKVAELQRAIGAGDHEPFTFAHARHVIDGAGGSLEAAPSAPTAGENGAAAPAAKTAAKKTGGRKRGK